MAFAHPVRSEEEVKEKLDELKKAYYDGRHHCFAWVLGMDDQSWRANDDGEPSHSAGDPILGQIRSHGLTNVLVVVVRYFGGTKLGVGGLIHAYKSATDDALVKAEKIQIYEQKHIILNFSYDSISIVERLVSAFEIDVVDRNYQVACELSGFIKKDVLKKFEIKVKDLYDLTVKVEE